MEISGKTKISDLLKHHPFLEAFLVEYNPKFSLLKNKAMRATVGRVASLRMVAQVGGVDLDNLLGAIAGEIEKQTGETVDVLDLPPEDDSLRQERIDVLKQIIKDLHDGGDLETARQKFAVAIADVAPTEIAEMEQQLIKDGLPVEEVQRLCDVHAGAFKHILDEQEDVEAPPGHPIHTYMAANQVLTGLADKLVQLTGELAASESEPEQQRLHKQVGEVLEQLTGVENHYQRKENQIFPYLEKHDITAPPKVMWGVHDEIRGQLKAARKAHEEKTPKALHDAAAVVARSLAEMVYKENKILLPLCHRTFTEQEWAEIRHGEDELGYVLAQPAAEWPVGGDARAATGSATGGELSGDLLAMRTGALTLEQLNLILTHLPVDISFVDENDVVQYYSDSPHRHFPRSPAVIGRKVHNCHPQKSVHIVKAIVDAFRKGTRDTAEFWITLHGKFLHIRYFAVRDDQGRYRGCLEMGQDVTEIRKLEGEQRLLSWDEQNK